ncbi:XF1762 family protein [Kitasatospora sp. NPDC001603]|uniref:XF1762 family protein n=1 Tax=Kitasatospora sp. NPDC001603 TaxID=3154388 RepID=UPI00332D1244
MSLHLVPVRDREAARSVRLRHHRTPRGRVFAVAGADDDGRVRTVAVAHRPTAGLLDDGTTLEVTFADVGTGAPAEDPMLYTACRRAAESLGYTRLVTYARDDESAARARRAGWRAAARRRARPGEGPVVVSLWQAP